MSTHEPRVQNLVDDLVSNRIDRRQFVRRAFALGLAAPAVSAILAACGGGDEEGAAPAGGGTEAGGEATAAIAETAAQLTVQTGEVSNVDPAFWPASPDYQTGAAIHEGLVTYKPGTLEVVNQLAETFTPSADGLAYEFKLKEGILFHKDYGELTAEDVKYSFERIAGLNEPKLDSPYKGDWSPALKEVQVKNKYEGVILLKEPFAAIMRSTLPVGAGLVLSKKAIEERGEKIATDPVGTGPYQWETWKPGVETVLTRFAEYGGASDEILGTLFDRIRLVTILEHSAADIALETGETDFSEISLQGIDRFEQNDDFTVYKQETLNYYWIGMNVLHPKLEDIRVRQAIRLAIDVPSMLEAAFEGRMTRATSILPPGMGLGYWEDAPVYDRDVDAAKGLMADAGVSSLELKFTFTEDVGTKQVAQIAQANLADIGIKVNLEKVDGAAFYELGKNLRQRELFYVGYVTEPDPSWSTVWFICDQLDVWNWMYWCDKEFDRLHFAALKEQDEAKRHEMYIEMQKRWDEAAHTVWTHWPTNYWAARKGVTPSIYPTGYWQLPAFTVEA